MSLHLLRPTDPPPGDLIPLVPSDPWSLRRRLLHQLLDDPRLDDDDLAALLRLIEQRMDRHAP